MSDFRPYRPAVPAGLPPGHPLPRPARPRALAVTGWVAFGAVALGTGLLTFMQFTQVAGTLGTITGTVLAAVPVFPVLATYLWLDRYEAEPTSLLVFAFVWGMAVATFAALVVNTTSAGVIARSGGDPTSAAFLVAPFVEEGVKGLAIVLIVVTRRREFDGVVDGVVYAGMVGIGFAAMENVLYLGRQLHEFGVEGLIVLIVLFVIRCVVQPFAHPLFTAATGIGLGVAARSRSLAVRVLAPLAGYAVAVTLHGVWNLSSYLGVAWLVFVVFYIPLFAAFVVFALLARRREGRLIARHLGVYADTGWLAPSEVGMLAPLSARRDARGWAGRVGGPQARRAMRDFQEMASELAFLRERMVRGTGPDDARTQEYAMLAAMSALRGRFLPRPVAPPTLGGGYCA